MPFHQTEDGAQLHYNDWGSGPPVVLIHGWPLDADMWEYSSVYLAESGFRVITYDRRGFGRSSQPWEGYDYDRLAGDLAGLMETLDLRGAALVGFSMGGGEVARYVGRFGQERLSRVAFISSVTPFLLKTGDNPDGADPAIFDQMIDGLRSDRPGFLASFGRKFFGAGMLNFSVGSEILEHALMMALRGSPRATLACVRGFSATDFRADLRKISVPTLIIHGGSDQTVPPGVSAGRMPALVPHAALTIYDGAPHGLHYTERSRLNEDLLRFLK